MLLIERLILIDWIGENNLSREQIEHILMEAKPRLRLQPPGRITGRPRKRVPRTLWRSIEANRHEIRGGFTALVLTWAVYRWYRKRKKSQEVSAIAALKAAKSAKNKARSDKQKKDADKAVSIWTKRSKEAKGR